MLAPCSDICHPIKFRRSNLDIENHDLLIPPSDGKTSEMVPASAIDPDHTPSPITHLSKKYSLDASIFGELISSCSNGSLEWAKKKISE
ncbi:hypothetical protein Nepgr_021690 [Nepenthes gracilis]|uniref:Uncharacterized protein n=1 Tax=Nepenthes gracilis TaxID=150966 RepID=A0AAD3SZQ6_NEPGR|nr:hypothetical protein Nepgr_021690 [Nepenthes gracilis]